MNRTGITLTLNFEIRENDHEQLLYFSSDRPHFTALKTFAYLLVLEVVGMKLVRMS